MAMPRTMGDRAVLAVRPPYTLVQLSMDVKVVGFAIIAVLGGVIFSSSAALEKALMQAFSQSTAAQRLAVLYTQGTPLQVTVADLRRSRNTAQPLHFS